MDNVLAGLEDIIGHFGDNRLRVTKYLSSYKWLPCTCVGVENVG